MWLTEGVTGFGRRAKEAAGKLGADGWLRPWTALRARSVVALMGGLRLVGSYSLRLSGGAAGGGSRTAGSGSFYAFCSLSKAQLCAAAAAALKAFVRMCEDVTERAWQRLLKAQ